MDTFNLQATILETKSVEAVKDNNIQEVDISMTVKKKESGKDDE